MTPADTQAAVEPEDGRNEDSMNDASKMQDIEFYDRDLDTSPLQSGPLLYSTPFAALASALASAQSIMKDPERKLTAKVKTRGGAEYEYSYPDFHDALVICRETLAKNDIAWVQPTFVTNGTVMLETRLIHKSGEWLASHWPLFKTDSDLLPQDKGALMTYARRYSLFSLIGLTPESAEESPAFRDQGRAASKETKPKGEDFWGGPLGKTAFKKAMMEFNTDLHSCEDEDSLVAFLNHQETVNLLEQCRNDMPTWWYGGGGDTKSIQTRIEERRMELEK